MLLKVQFSNYEDRCPVLLQLICFHMYTLAQTVIGVGFFFSMSKGVIYIQCIDLQFLPEAFWPTGIVITFVCVCVCVCICVCVCLSVCQLLPCPRDNSSSVQARIT